MNKTSYHFNLGQYKCIAFNDGVIPPLPLPDGTPIDKEAQAMDVMCLLIDTGSHKVLIDTGCGEVALPHLGKLLQNMKAEGIKPEAIDVVIYTHGHSDHVAGSFDRQGRPVFPGARYKISRKEWDSWVNRPERKELSPMFEDARRNLLRFPERCDLIEDNAEALPGMRMIPAPGHTPGAIMLEVTSGSQKLLCIGDMIHDPLEFKRPDYYGFLDYSCEQAVSNRTRLLSEAANKRQWVFACHFDFPGLGYTVQKGAILGWEPHL